MERSGMTAESLLNSGARERAQPLTYGIGFFASFPLLFRFAARRGMQQNENKSLHYG